MQERVKSKLKVVVEIDAGLVETARVSGVDLSTVLEQALEMALGAGGECGPSDADRAVMSAHNRYVEEHGTLADSLRDL